MTKHDAVMMLLSESRRLRQSVSSNQHIIVALKTLGFAGEELLRTGNALELWRENGEPYLTRAPRSPSFAEADARVLGNGG